MVYNSQICASMRRPVLFNLIPAGIVLWLEFGGIHCISIIYFSDDVYKSFWLLYVRRCQLFIMYTWPVTRKTVKVHMRDSMLFPLASLPFWIRDHFRFWSLIWSADWFLNSLLLWNAVHWDDTEMYSLLQTLKYFLTESQTPGCLQLSTTHNSEIYFYFSVLDWELL